MKACLFSMFALVGMVLGQQQKLPYDSVDCDNANGNPKLCTVETDEPDAKQSAKKPLQIPPNWTKRDPCPKGYRLRLGYRMIPEDAHNPLALCTRMIGNFQESEWDWKF